MDATRPARRAVAAFVAILLVIAASVHGAPETAEPPDRSRPAAISPVAPALPSVAGARSDAPGGSQAIALDAILAGIPWARDALLRGPANAQHQDSASVAEAGADSRAPPLR